MNRAGLAWILAGSVAIAIGLALRERSDNREFPRSGTPSAIPFEPIGGAPLPDLAGGLKLTSWNLQWFPGRSPGEVAAADQMSHIAAVARQLEKIDPDILCLQEVKDPAALEQLIAEALPDHTLQVISNFRGTQEVAILSRHEAKSAFMEEFEKAEATPPRGFAFASFRFGDQALAVYTVHLKSNIGGIEETTSKREESARQLLRHAAAITRQFEGEGTPVTIVLSGDFNHDPGRADWAGDDTLRILLDAGFVWTGRGLPRGETITWLSDGRYPDAAFDHILVKAAGGAAFGRAVTEMNDRAVSDHRPLSVTFQLKREESRR